MKSKGVETESAGLQRQEIDKQLIAHLSSCAVCRKSLHRLSKDVFIGDVLTCDECSLRIPLYYEVTHPLSSDAAETSMPLVDMIEVALHLNACAACRASYRTLARLWDEDLL